MLDRDRVGISLSNELFRFSTTKQQWEQLDAPQVSGSPPSAGVHVMVSVGIDLYVFNGGAGHRVCVPHAFAPCLGSRV
jgi:hypothetical protein